MTTYATEIRDAAKDLLTAAAVAADLPYARTRTNWGWQLEPDTDFPALSVFVPRETLSPDGDSNAAEPSFVNDVTLGVIVSLGYKVPEELDIDASARGDAILNTLLTTPSFLALFESVERVEQSIVFAKDGETFIAEVALNITIRFRTDWPPAVPDYLTSVSVTSRPLGKDEKTPPTILHIDLDQE